MNGVALYLKDQIHNLEVLLNPAPSLEIHVLCCVCLVVFFLGGGTFYQLVHQLWPSLIRDSLTIVIHTWGIFCLIYSSVLYIGLPLKQDWPIHEAS